MYCSSTHRSRIDSDASIHEPNPFTHADETQATLAHDRAAIKTTATIGDDKVNLTCRTIQSHLEVLNVTVSSRILECLLHYSVETQRKLLWQIGRNILVSKIDLYRLPVGELSTEALHCSRGSDVFQK